MCGLYGFLHYGKSKIKGLKEITNALAREAAERGTDAAGIAFNENGRLMITKEGKSAERIDFKHSDKITAMTGHTRHSTQGSEKKNYNNHPFGGRCRNVNFALAHNGVLMNDKELRKKYHLPKTKIETDSYIAVQLLEHKKELNEESIKFMAEALQGSFSFSIVDSGDRLWLIKGDSPLHIIHFPNSQLYVYASTEKILWKALVETDLFDELKSGSFEEIPIHSGDILKILPDGNVMFSKFDYEKYSRYGFYDWWYYGTCCGKTNSYIDDLKSVAAFEGICPDDIGVLLGNGFTPEEIEEYIYCGVCEV